MCTCSSGSPSWPGARGGERRGAGKQVGYADRSALPLIVASGANRSCVRPPSANQPPLDRSSPARSTGSHVLCRRLEPARPGTAERRCANAIERFQTLSVEERDLIAHGGRGSVRAIPKKADQIMCQKRHTKQKDHESPCAKPVDNVDNSPRSLWLLATDDSVGWPRGWLGVGGSFDSLLLTAEWRQEACEQ
jgi:hypothetical protein